MDALTTQGNVAAPADAGRLINRWEALGRPVIELEPGIGVSNLERWLYNNPPAPGARMGRLREYLYIDTLGSEVRAA